MVRRRDNNIGVSQVDGAIYVITSRDSLRVVKNAQCFAMTSSKETSKLTIFVGGTLWQFQLKSTLPQNRQKF